VTEDQRRLFFKYPPYGPALENVYQCGAFTHPGGSIRGAGGRNAAGAICEDPGIARRWSQ
jgi:phytoene dehydrogenase-like protein